jgi:hypothetical protein
MQSTEQWKPVVGYEGVYEVSDHGRVRGVDRVIQDSVRGNLRRLKARLLKVSPLPTGHLYVNLCRNGKATSTYVHRMVLEAFVGPSPSDHEGCHWDGDPSNNHLDNLRWGTRSDNVQDAIRHGTYLGARRRRV